VRAARDQGMGKVSRKGEKSVKVAGDNGIEGN